MVNNSGKHGKQVRKAVTVQLVYGIDDDLIKAITNLSEGERQATLKNWLRESQGFATMLKEKNIDADHSEAMKYLVEGVQYLVSHTDWTQKTLTELPAHLERLLKTHSLKPVSPFASTEETPEQPSLSQEALNTRAKRVKRW